MESMTRLLTAALISFATAAFAQEAPRAETTQPRPPGAESRLFNVVLLVASADGTDDVQGVSKSAEKALADLRDFLPFRSYRLLDSGLMRVGAGTFGTIHLAGPSDQPLKIFLSYSGSDGRKLNVRSFGVTQEPKSTGKTLGPGEAPRAARELMTAAFTIEVGETIVVGSSKLHDPRSALVVLVTAVPGK